MRRIANPHRTAGTRGVPAIAPALAAAGLAAAIACGAPREPQAEGRPARRDVVVVEGLDLPGTADESQRTAIRSLLEAAGKATEAAALTVDYPAPDSIVPPDLAAPTILWHDAAAAADRWLVDIDLGDGSARLRVLVPGDPPAQGEIDRRCLTEHNEIYEGTPYQRSARTWRPDEAVWGAITKRSVERPAVITFMGYRDGHPSRVLSRGRLSLRTSRDPAGAPIFYRDVPLMPSQTEEGVIKPLAQNAVPLINWRLKDVSRRDSRIMLTDMPTCANCHSFSSDGRTLGIDIDGPQGDRGAYAVVPVAEKVVIGYEQVMTWNAFRGKPKDFMTIGFLSRVSPDGRHVVSTVNEALYVMNFWDYKFSQVFYPTRGILAVYSRATRAIEALPGADDTGYVHCDPTWTPDGRTIVFARARATDPYVKGRPAATYAGDPNEIPIQYDLYRIPFDGGRGGRAEPIEGASANGTSNNFPKVSPDGKWIVFVRCRNGQLMRPDGRLWIVPAAGGEARLMRCNLPLMNSWHSFSPNGRWMVFSSKGRTPYTQMFLTHLDEDGNDSPAILVEDATAANRAVNLPEFVDVRYGQFLGIEVPAVEHARHFSRGEALARDGRHREAVAEFERALAGEKNDWKTSEWRIHDRLSRSLLVLGEKDRALPHLRESLRLNPANAEMQTNLANLLFERGEAEEAFEHIDRAIRLAPDDARLWYNRATMRLQRGDRAAAVADYTEAIRRNPRYAEAYLGRGMALGDAGDPRAAADIERTIGLDPKIPTSWYLRGLARFRRGDRSGAYQDLSAALRVAPPDWPRRREAEEIRRQIRATNGRERPAGDSRP